MSAQQEITDSKVSGWEQILEATIAEMDPDEQTAEDAKAAAAAATSSVERRAREHTAKVLLRVEDMRANADAQKHYEAGRRAKFAKALADPNAVPTLTTFPINTLRGKAIQPEMVDGLIGAPGSLNLASGYMGSMKSLAALSIAGAIGTGMPTLWGLKVNVHGPVLFIYRESPDNLIKRMEAWEAYYGRSMENVHVYTGAIDMKDPLDVQQVALMVRKHKAVLVIIDPVAATGGGKEDSEDFGAYRLGLESLRDATSASIYVNHNAGHGEKGRGRGHSTLADAMDSAVSFERPSEKCEYIVLTDKKSRDSAPLKDIKLKYAAAGKLGSGTPVRMNEAEAKAANRAVLMAEIAPVLAAIDASNGGATAREVALALGKQQTNLGRELKPYLDAHLIEKVGRTNTLRYVRGDDPSLVFFTPDQELPNSTQKGREPS